MTQPARDPWATTWMSCERAAAALGKYLTEQDMPANWDEMRRLHKDLWGQVYGQAALAKKGNPEPTGNLEPTGTNYDVTVAEYSGNITVHIQGIRASASLSKLGESGAETFGLEPDNWLWFNRLINQSEILGIGTMLLDKVLEYCQEKGYSIANQVSAYGDLSQRDLEDWYIRKGFIPVNASKYGNAFLKWVPE